ncbi:MAG: cytochrome-c peroxidase [Bacteroidetes bacterium]|nr:cytochrome-c peroxidase [Bacteroidota bacterium]
MIYHKPYWIALLLGTLFLISSSSFEYEPSLYVFPELKYFPTMPLAANNPVTQEGIELGRFLFYDPILSKDSSISCANCHKQEYAFSDGGKRFSSGINNSIMNRNTPALFNLAWNKGLFWDGRANSIEEQVFHPVRKHDEMGLNWQEVADRLSQDQFYRKYFIKAFGNVDIDSTLVARAIAQFERTLISNNSKYDQALNREIRFTKEEFEGFVLMNDQTKGDCLHCHTTDADPLGTTGTFSNNGLDSVTDPYDYLDPGLGAITKDLDDYGKFRIPSLRNVMLTGPYMHDGRFQTLEEVLVFYSEGVHQSINIDSKMTMAHRGGVHLTKDEQRKIIVFLRTLTDSTFIRDCAYSNPFMFHAKPQSR